MEAWWLPRRSAQPPLAMPEQLVDGFLDASKHRVVPNASYQVRPYERIRSDEEFLNLLKYQQQLVRSLEVLSAKDGGTDPEQTLALQAVSQTARVLDDFVVDMLGWDPLLQVPSDSSAAKAQEAFSIPELAEMILLELPSRELLKVAQVDRALHASVMSSKRINCKLGLVPEPDSWFKTNLSQDHEYSRGCCDRKLTLPGLSFLCDNVRLGEDSEEGEDDDDGEEESGEGEYMKLIVELRPKVEFVSPGSSVTTLVDRVPNVGSRGRAMLICQPPILKMDASTTCCGERVEIHSAMGVTVGDLLDATSKLRYLHRTCPLAQYHLHDHHSGFVVPEVVFKGNLPLRPDDRSILNRNWNELEEQNYDVFSPYDFRPHHPDRTPPPPSPLTQYVDAKHKAHKAGDRIPTFQDFLGTIRLFRLDPQHGSDVGMVYTAAAAELFEMGLSVGQAHHVAETLVSWFVDQGATLAQVVHDGAKLLPWGVVVEGEVWRKFAEWLTGMVREQEVIGEQRDREWDEEGSEGSEHGEDSELGEDRELVGEEDDVVEGADPIEDGDEDAVVEE
jgi:hypothetical protein